MHIPSLEDQRTAMYLPYVMFGYGAAVLLMLAGCGVSAASVPGLRGVRLLAWGYSVGLAGVMLLGLRPYLPAWATILLSNEAIFAFPLFFYSATAEILGIPARHLRAGIAMMGSTAVILAYFTYVQPDLTARILVASGFPGLCAAVTAAILMQYRESRGDSSLESRVPLARALGWLQILLAVQHAVRCVLTLAFPPEQVLHLDLIQAGYTYINMMLTIGAGCGLIWLSLYMQRNDMQTRAQTDGLTGLLNRRAFEEVLELELSRSFQSRTQFSLLLMDIDRFKQVNDVWGHQAGDEVIRRVSRALSEGTRPSDSISRFGGEEFVVLLRETSVDRAAEVAERLRGAVSCLTGLPGDDPVTMSFGVTVSQPGDGTASLLRRCDEALYQSKRNGRNLVTVAASGVRVPGVAAGLLSETTNPSRASVIL